MKGYIKISKIETSLNALSFVTKSIPQASMKTKVPLVCVNHATRLLSLVHVGDCWNYALEAIINCIIIIPGSLLMFICLCYNCNGLCGGLPSSMLTASGGKHICSACLVKLGRVEEALEVFDRAQTTAPEARDALLTYYQ